MARQRAKNELTVELCKLLLKTHVDSLADEKYKGDDMDAVVKRYVGFLAAVAQHTSRLSKEMVSGAALDIFGCSKVAAEKFGNAMKTAMSYCHNKGSKATTGKKLTESVKSVVLSFKNQSLLMSALQSKDSTPASSKTGSPCVQLHSDDEVIPVEAAAGSSSSAYQLPSAAEIDELYGCATTPPVKRARVGDISDSVEIVSSQEVDVGEAAPAPKARLINLRTRTNRSVQ